MYQPWLPSSSDEWLPRRLRLCWGGSDGSDGGATTGPGDWGSSGAYDASSFGAGPNASLGWAVDAAMGFGQFGTGPGEWYDFGPYNAAGLNVSDPNLVGTNLGTFQTSGITSGPGDW